MNKKLINVLFVIAALLASSCTENNQNSKHYNNKNDKTEETAKNKTEADSTAVSNLKIEKIQGDIRNIYYAEDSKIFISADKLYLYDLRTDNILAETPRELFEQENYWVIKNGYVAVGEKNNHDNNGDDSLMINGEKVFSAVFYDKELNKKSQYNLNSLFDDDTLFLLDAISFSADGKLAAYAILAGLYVFDFKKGSTTKIVDLETEDGKDRAGIVAFEQIGFTNNDKTIAFKAQSADVPAIPDKPSFDTCGIVHTDGSGLSNRTFNNYTCKELTAYNKSLLFAEDFTKTTGNMLVMESPSGKEAIHKVTNKDESGHISGSDSGRYFATSVSNKKDTGWEVRIYNTETGNLEAKQFVSADGKELYMAHDPIIKVIDETRTCIVLLGSKINDIETKLVVSKF